MDWETDYGDAGDYTPIFRVTDPEGNFDEIRYVNLTILDVAQEPDVLGGENQEDDEEVDVRVDEGQELIYLVLGFDPDGDNQGLEWEWIGVDNQNLPPGPAGEEARVEEDQEEPNMKRLFWTPPYDAAREDPYIVTFRVTKPAANLSDELVISIFVDEFNPPPARSNAGEDLNESNQVVNEDEGPLVIGDLDDLFIDLEGGQLDYEFEIEGDLPGVVFDPDNDNVLTIRFAEHFNLPDPGAEVTITAIEPDAQLDERIIFTLINNPIDDAPGAFNLASPETGFALNRGEYNDLVFEWTSSANFDEQNGDVITYNLLFSVSTEDVDTTHVEEGIEDTTFNFENLEQQLIDMGIYVEDGDQRVNVTWWVVAEDNTDSTMESSERWTIDLEIPLSVPGWRGGAPTEFMLSTNYPNPFNPSTKLYFEMPYSSMVNFTVWDLHGRRVANIISNRIPAGRHYIEWNANGMSAGIYLFKLDVGGQTFISKGALVR